MRAGKYLGVAPWELGKQPACWTHWALMAERAEVEASRSKVSKADAKPEPEKYLSAQG